MQCIQRTDSLCSSTVNKSFLRQDTSFVVIAWSLVVNENVYFAKGELTKSTRTSSRIASSMN
jgi:hypothetical protein